jgi:hypothetical protein
MIEASSQILEIRAKENGCFNKPRKYAVREIARSRLLYNFRSRRILLPSIKTLNCKTCLSRCRQAGSMIELGPLQSPGCQWNNGCSNVGFLKAFSPGAVSHRRYFGEVVMRKWCGGFRASANFSHPNISSVRARRRNRRAQRSGSGQERGARVVVLNESTKEVLRTEERLVHFALCYAL